MNIIESAQTIKPAELKKNAYIVNYIGKDVSGGGIDFPHFRTFFIVTTISWIMEKFVIPNIVI